MTTWREGSHFGDYELLHRLGGGGFGEVWLAQKPDAARVALKILHGQHQSGEAVRIRAEIELLAAAASSRSAHIVRVLDGGSQPAPHVIMEYIEGVDLGGEITRRGALPAPEVLKVADAIADALSTLQLLGIIHRDVKPANVMIDTKGIVKLTDFGIAKIVGIDTVTATSQMPMSMAYAAPEVWEGKASYLSDHYAFGALLYHCLAGRPPFGGSYAEIYRHHLMTPPDLIALPSNTPASLRSLIGECLAKDPEQRPQTATALHNAVSAALREMTADQAATVILARLQEPKQIGPWIIDSRNDAAEWTFACHHETSSESALVEVHFADDLEYGQTLRRRVAEHPNELLATSRFIFRPGEGFAGTPTSLFLYWLARLPAPIEPNDATQIARPDPGLARVAPDATDATQIQRPPTPIEVPAQIPEPVLVAASPVVRPASAEHQTTPAQLAVLRSLFLLYMPAQPWWLVFHAIFYLAAIAALLQIQSALHADLTRGEFEGQAAVVVLIPLLFTWAFARFGPGSSDTNSASHHFSLISWPGSSGGRFLHVLALLLYAGFLVFFYLLVTSVSGHDSLLRLTGVFAVLIAVPLVATALHVRQMSARSAKA